MSDPNATLIAAAMREHCDEILLDLLTLSPPGFPFEYLTSNPTNVFSRGITYIAYPFEVRDPEDSKEAQTSIPITIGNIDRRLIEAIRTVAGAIPVKLECVLASDPNTVQLGPYDLLLKQTVTNAAAISGRLSYESALQRPWPGFKFTPKRNPGLFGRTS